MGRFYEQQETGQKSCSQEASKKTGQKEHCKKKVSEGEGARRSLLENELKKLIPQIEEEGLKFLLQQSQILIHNQNIERINKALLKTQQSVKTASETKGGKAKTSEREDVFVEEASSGKNFVLTLGNERKIFTRDEFRKLVGIAQSTNSKEAGVQIFNWLKRFRGDVLYDVKISSHTHPLFFRLATYLQKHYRLKK